AARYSPGVQPSAALNARWNAPSEPKPGPFPAHVPFEGAGECAIVFADRRRPRIAKADDRRLTSTMLEVLRCRPSNTANATMSTSLKDPGPYLARLGFDASPPPTLDTLRQLQLRHTAAFPFE